MSRPITEIPSKPAGPTQLLADFIAAVRPSDVPVGLRAVLLEAVMDAIGCGLFGLTLEACAIVQDFAFSQGGPPEATLWASGGRKVSAANMALAAGTAIHGFDFDDHHRAKIHISAVVLPAALSIAERDGMSGPRLLAALAAGYEAMARVSLAANPNAARLRGWHLTGTCGTFGAAAACASLFGIDGWETASALGLAGTQSSGLWAFNADGAMSKRLHPGRAAQSGVMAALLARSGFQGPRMILETKDGGFLTAMSDQSRVEEIMRDLGSQWRAEAVCFKPYACCGSNHACIDAAIALMREHGFTAGDVASVTAGVSRVVLVQTGFPYSPTTVLSAQMSLRYNLAVALTDGNALLEQFTPERIADPAVCDLASRVEVEVDPEMDRIYPGKYAGIATINLKDGRVFTRRVDESRGMPENRISRPDLERKFLSLAGMAVGGEAASGLLAAIKGIFDLADIRPLAERLGAMSMKPVGVDGEVAVAGAARPKTAKRTGRR